MSSLIYSRELSWSTRWCLPLLREKVSQVASKKSVCHLFIQCVCLLTSVGKRVGRNVGKSVGSKVGPRVLIETKEEEVEILALKTKRCTFNTLDLLTVLTSVTMSAQVI